MKKFLTSSLLGIFIAWAVTSILQGWEIVQFFSLKGYLTFTGILLVFISFWIISLVKQEADNTISI